jgi:hypothetical protein
MHQGQASQPGGSEEFLARFQRALHKNEIWRCAMALLSQEGSTIERKRDRARGGSKAASLQGLPGNLPSRDPIGAARASEFRLIVQSPPGC